MAKREARWLVLEVESVCLMHYFGLKKRLESDLEPERVMLWRRGCVYSLLPFCGDPVISPRSILRNSMKRLQYEQGKAS